MLPIMLFMIFYKSIWLAVVAYRLWSTGQLAGSANEMGHVFAGVWLPALAVPWGYVARNVPPNPQERPTHGDAPIRRQSTFRPVAVKGGVRPIRGALLHARTKGWR